MKTRQIVNRVLMCITVALIIAVFVQVIPSQAGSLSGAYIDPSYLKNVPFGSRSHWLQPWRAWLDTMPATVFLNGLGTAWNGIPDSGANPELIMEMLAKHGIKTIRLEIGWDTIQPGGGINNGTANILAAAKKNGVRPLILLNANSGAPNPIIRTTRTVTGGSGKSITLNDTSGLVVGRSGISGTIAGQAIITAINGNSVTLSQNLPHGGSVEIFTFTYRPFSPQNTQDYKDTIAGWNQYADIVAQYVAQQLGTVDNTSDKGFDMEIWNEMSFGSEYMDINNYYDPDLYSWDHESVFLSVVADTMAHVAQHPEIYAGVNFCDGYANTLPWQSAGGDPNNLRALCKHPYFTGYGFSHFQGKNTLQGTRPKDALGNDTSFEPSYKFHFPEYYLNALQTETTTRDMAPYNETGYGTGAHGVNGKPGKYTPVWITEVGEIPDEIARNNGFTLTTEEGLWYKAKANARWWTMFLNKNAEKVYVYTAGEGDRSWGVVLDSFITYAKSNSTYPADDSTYTSPTLKILGNIVNKFEDGLDATLTRETTDKITVDSISDTHDHFQFQGDGTAAHPNLFNRELLTILPYQVNRSKWIIPYYVMTRDLFNVYQTGQTGGHQYDLVPEQYTVKFSGTTLPSDQSVRIYDPWNDRTVPVTVVARGTNTFTLSFVAADYPYLLIIDGQSTAITPSTDPTCPKKPLGDANCDGKVSLADYSAWRGEFTGQLTTKTADFNTDTKVSLADYSTWRTSFTKGL